MIYSFNHSHSLQNMSINYKSPEGQLLEALEYNLSKSDKKETLISIISWWKQYWTANPTSDYEECKNAISTFGWWNKEVVLESLYTFSNEKMDPNMFEFIDMAIEEFCDKESKLVLVPIHQFTDVDIKNEAKKWIESNSFVGLGEHEYTKQYIDYMNKSKHPYLGWLEFRSFMHKLGYVLKSDICDNE